MEWNKRWESCTIEFHNGHDLICGSRCAFCFHRQELFWLLIVAFGFERSETKQIRIVSYHFVSYHLQIKYTRSFWEHQVYVEMDEWMNQSQPQSQSFFGNPSTCCPRAITPIPKPLGGWLFVFLKMNLSICLRSRPSCAFRPGNPSIIRVPDKSWTAGKNFPVCSRCWPQSTARIVFGLFSDRPWFLFR